MKEMVGGCCVCSDERGWTENPLVYCDGNQCNVAVHQACYGIVQVPTGPWFCRKCESQERQARVRCELCPSKDGALKRTDTDGWAHVVCSLYIPEVRFGNVITMEPIILALVPPERYHKTCYICEEQGKESRASVGACMQCNKPGCKQHFHVTCAQAAGLLCEEAGNFNDNVKYCGYCAYHYQKLKKTGANIKPIPAFKPVPIPVVEPPPETIDKKKIEIPDKPNSPPIEAPKPLKEKEPSGSNSSTSLDAGSSTPQPSTGSNVQINNTTGSSLASMSKPLPDGPQTLEQLLERQWNVGAQLIMEQSQHFDVASLLSCLHQLRNENERLEERVRQLIARRDHLIAVNSRLSLPLNGSINPILTSLGGLSSHGSTISQNGPGNSVSSSLLNFPSSNPGANSSPIYDNNKSPRTSSTFIIPNRNRNRASNHMPTNGDITGPQD